MARHLGVNWDTIKEFQEQDLGRRFARPRLERIAIDKIAVGKGHRYLTVVLDLESGAVVFVGDGKGADALKPFWRRLRRSGATIEAVACAEYLRVHVDHTPYQARLAKGRSIGSGMAEGGVQDGDRAAAEAGRGAVAAPPPGADGGGVLPAFRRLVRRLLGARRRVATRFRYRTPGEGRTLREIRY